jgi:hypothetical protein
MGARIPIWGLGDGVRPSLDLEDMGRLGLLAHGNGMEAAVLQWFVQEPGKTNPETSKL